MRNRFAALLTVLLVLTLFLPMGAMADPPCFIDAIGREVMVPDGWKIETGADGKLDFTHDMAQGRIILSSLGIPVEEIDTPDLTADVGVMLAGAAAISSGASDPTPLPGFDYASDGRRIIGGAVTYEQNAKQMVMWAFIFTSVDNTWDTCSFCFPTDGSLDVSWIWGAMEAVFPELSTVSMTTGESGAEAQAVAESRAADDSQALSESPDASTEAAAFTYGIKDGTAIITGCADKNPTGNLVIPNQIGGYPVTGIGNSAFYGCSGLTSVTIPNSVTSIGGTAFYQCASITVIIPKSVTRIDDYAFDWWRVTLIVEEGSYAEAYAKEQSISYYHDLSLAVSGDKDASGQWRYALEDGGAKITAYGDVKPTGNLVIPNVLGGYPVTAIGDRAFYGCVDLTGVAIPEGVTRIGDEAFSYCTGLTRISLPDSLTSVGYSVFNTCSALTTIPPNLTIIGQSMFSSCNGLTEVVIPEGVTEINQNAFISCKGITRLAIPEGVTHIRSRAFWSCESLKTANLPASLESADSEAFDDCPKLTLSVPKQSYAERYAKSKGIRYKMTERVRTQISTDWLTELTDDDIARVIRRAATLTPHELVAAFAVNARETYWALAESAVPIAPIFRYFEKQGGLTKPKAAKGGVSFTVAKDFADQWRGKKTVTAAVMGLDAKAWTVPAASLAPLVAALESQWNAPSDLAKAFAENPQSAYFDLAGDNLPLAPLLRYYEGQGLTKVKGAKDTITLTVSKRKDQWGGLKTLKIPVTLTDAKALTAAPEALPALNEAIAMEWTLPPPRFANDLLSTQYMLAEKYPTVYVEYVEGHRIYLSETSHESKLGFSLHIGYQSKRGNYLLRASFEGFSHSQSEYQVAGDDKVYQFWESDQEPHVRQLEKWELDWRNHRSAFPDWDEYTGCDLYLQEEGVKIAGRSAKRYSGTDYDGRPLQIWIDDKYPIALKYVVMEKGGAKLYAMMEITSFKLKDDGFPTLDVLLGKYEDFEKQTQLESEKWLKVLSDLGYEPEPEAPEAQAALYESVWNPDKEVPNGARAALFWSCHCTAQTASLGLM